MSKEKVLFFGLGAIVGAAVSFFVTRHLCEKQAQQINNEVRNYYANKEPKKQFVEEDYSEFVRATRNITPVPPEKVDYAGISSRYVQCSPPELSEVSLEDGEEYDPDYEDDGEDMHPEDSVEEELIIKPLHKEVGDDPEPYIITYQEYASEDGMFQRDDLTFYARDGVIADNLDEPVDPELIGIDNIALLETKDTIYVKNFECGMKWEIVKVDASFHDLMTGETQID